MKKVVFLVISAAIFILGSIASVQAADKQTTNKIINIIGSSFPEYDFARAIVGDRANVTMLTPPGASVHSFEPSPNDIIRIQNADVFIYVGGESNAWVKRILDSIDTSNIRVIRLMDYVETMLEEIKEGMEVEPEDDDEDSEDEHEYDEHIWTSPKNAIRLIDEIYNIICEIDSANAVIYRDNAVKYKDELRKINDEITEIVSKAVRKIIVVADKFPFLYFVREYGLDYAAAFPGCSDQVDAGIKTILHLVKTVEDGKIPHIYHVELSNQSVASAISEQTGAGMLQLNSCHNLSKTDFEAGMTYLDLMRQNIENLKKGLW